MKWRRGPQTSDDSDGTKEQRLAAPTEIRCYVETWQHPVLGSDLRLREKTTGRVVRIVTDDARLAALAPMVNLLADSFTHGGGLVEAHEAAEYVAVSGVIVGEDDKELGIALDEDFFVRVNISTTGMASPPTSVWCYVEEYSVDRDQRGVRLREKVTGRKVEMWGQDKAALVAFLSSPRLSGAHQYMPNLYERFGYDDYVLVSGGTTVDTFDSVRFADGSELTYLLGPTFDTAYRDAFRVMTEEHAYHGHARAARAHVYEGRYREAVLSARLAVDAVCGGDGKAIKRRLTDAPRAVSEAAAILLQKRGIAVHESATRVEQLDAEQAVAAMHHIVAHIESEGGSE